MTQPTQAQHLCAQDIGDALGVPVNRELIERLGFPRLYGRRRASFWDAQTVPQIRQALINHLQKAQHGTPR